jgi:hypothetical protein
MCKDLEGHIYEFGTKTSADLMRTMQEKIFQYVGMKFGVDIANELQKRTTFADTLPVYCVAISARHATREAMVRTQQQNMLEAFQASRCAIEVQFTAAPEVIDLPLSLAKVANDIVVLEYDISQPVEVQLTEQGNEYRNETKAHSDQVSKLKTH